jgi:sulfate permease, SulP family
MIHPATGCADRTPSPRPHAVPSTHTGDLRGGVAAATMTLITAVSYATVAGAPLGPAMCAGAVLSGLIGATLGGAVAAGVRSAPGLVFSPRASVAVVMASALSTVGAHTGVPGALVWLTACLLLAALLQLGFGLLRLGALIRLIPHSVTAGFTLGIAAEMAWSQWPRFFGPDVAQGSAVAAGLVTVVVIGLAQKRGLSGLALPAGVAAGAVAHAILAAWLPDLAMPHLQALDWQAAPMVSLPALLNSLGADAELVQLPSLLGFAFVIAFVNSIETLTATVVLEDLAQHRFDANGALIAGAVGSIAAVLAGGLPVAGSAATSVVNVKAGGRSRKAALIAAAALLLLAFISSQALALVPLAVVAGLMLTVAFALALAPLRELAAQNRRRGHQHGQPNTPWPVSGDTAVAALVCLLVLTTGVVTAVIGGVMAAAALLARQMRRTLVRRHYDANHADAGAHIHFVMPPQLARRIQVLELAQPLFFATAEAVVQLLERLQRGTRFAILDLTHVCAIDHTATRLLVRCGATLRLRNRELLLVLGAKLPAFESSAPADAPCELFASLGEALRFAARRCHDEAAADPTRSLTATHPTPWHRRLQHMLVPLRSFRDCLPLDPTMSSIHTPLDPQAVDQAGHELAVFVGPVAKLLARRAAPHCADLAALYRTLAQELHAAAAREAFLRHMPALTTLPSAPHAPSAVSTSATLQLGVSLAAGVLEQATHDLTPYLGPISKLLVKRAQAKALDREHLYHLLARQIGTTAERDAFLAAAGVDQPNPGST